MIDPTTDNLWTSLLSHGTQLEQQQELALAATHYRTSLVRHPAWSEGWFRLGVVCLKQKLLSEALTAFEKAISLKHRTAEAWNFSGIALGWLNHTPAAANAFQNAIRCNPQFADGYLNLGIALRQLQRPTDARKSLETALSLEPTNVAVLSNLSAVLAESGRLESAIPLLEQAVSIAPQNLHSIFSLATLYRSAGRIRDAERGFRIAIQMAPGFADAHLALGVLLAEQSRFEEAVTVLNHARELSPESPLVLANLGNALRELGKLELAETHLMHASSIAPDNPRILINVGTLYLEQRRLNEAQKLFRAALNLDDSNPNAHSGLAAVLTDLGEYKQADQHCRRAIDSDPTHASAHHNWSLILLVEGNWLQGFQEFEWRWKTSKFVPRGFAAPLWDGTPLPNASLLIHCEQGFGDTIQFCRYIKLAQKRVSEIIVEAPPPLIPLLSTCDGIDRLIAVGQTPGEVQAQIPLMSLPRIFETRMETVPNAIPYLNADPLRVRHWKQVLGETDKLRVGLAWRGSANYGRNTERSIPLSQLEALGQIKQVEFISLHRGEVTPEIESTAGIAIRDFGRSLDQEGAFIDTAALMENLDLVISIDSAAIHLAGALGRPAWLLSHYAPDWRWLLDREDTPWYPSIRIFRQATYGDWSEVIQRISCELQKLTSNLSTRLNRLV